ncbi:MAG: L,D-transpeptidase family protein [Verrucomicrobiales bacterium]
MRGDVDRRGGPVAQTAFAAALDRRDEAAALRLFALGAHPAFALSAEGAPVERAAGFRMNALLARMLERGWSPAGIAGCGAPLLAAVRSHNLEGARLLLDAGAAPPPGALRLACLRRDLPMARLLLEHGADPAGIVLLAWEFRDRRLLGLLAEFCADVDEACPDTGQRALAAAAEAGDLGFAKALLAAGADPDLPGADTQPPLAYALARRDAAFVDLLLKGGADPNTRLNTPVSESFRARFDMEDKELGYYLAKIDSGFTALMIAAAQNDLASARLLLKRGARTNLLTKKWRRYPINFAVDRGHLQMAQLIVGRDPESDSRKVHIVIDLSDQRARFIQDGEVVLSTRVSTGKKGNETKPGEYLVTFKHKDHRSNLYDAPMPFFLRLSCSDFGLHEGNVPGYPASHGCIRVPKKTAEKLFGMARLGDLVTIQE